MSRLYYRFTEEEVRAELARRRRCAAHSEAMGLVPQQVTEAMLFAQVAGLPLDHPDRCWRELELALAREHYRQQPDVPFVRHVVPPPKRGNTRKRRTRGPFSFREMER
jgi:hypothetical protein